MFDSVLIANRGEVSVRISSTLRRLGIRSIAVFSDADAGSRHVKEADAAVCIGPAAASESYLHIARIIEAAQLLRAQAVHPGYGFLAENAEFARACGAAGLIFIGPAPDVIRLMGDKIRAKETVGAAGVPVVPGIAVPGLTDDDLVAAARDIGFPLLVKPSAGGGGKGMHRVDKAEDLLAALLTARREALSSFGDDTLFLERFVHRPRHVEVQVLADTHGNIVHLGDRECSLQRRHQKIIEEAPAAFLDAEVRALIGRAACETAASVNYTGVGTVEFILSADKPSDFYFMEMNTRLQVEHPVTEMITGIDLVEQQLCVAAGEPIGFDQAGVSFSGHAFEARVYAEDPARGFLPTGGRALVVNEPKGSGIRVDSGLLEGAEVGVIYDPMLTKVLAWGPDRTTALARLHKALQETVILGVVTNLNFLQALSSHRDVRSGDLDTQLIERHLDQLLARGITPPVYFSMGLVRFFNRWSAASKLNPWDQPTGFRPGRSSRPLTYVVAAPDETPATVEVRGIPTSAIVKFASGTALQGSITPSDEAIPSHFLVTVDGISLPVIAISDGPSTWLHIDGSTWCLTDSSPPPTRNRIRHFDREVRSPMPGLVISIHVTNGELVDEGASLLTVEAMKMEYAVAAPIAGFVELKVNVGLQVFVDQVLVHIHEVNEESAVAQG